MKKNYNDLVRFYNRSFKKLRSLLASGKNPYKQDILKRRIARLFHLLKGMQTQIKLSHATVALSAGFMLFNPNAAKAQNFLTQVQNPFGLAATPVNWSTPFFVDLDNDGDKDILAGTTAGDFYYYQNIGTSAAPNYTAAVMNPFGITNTGTGYSQPSFVDIDNDGDLDLFSGMKSGDFWYQQNTGSVSSPTFTSGYTNPFGLVVVPDPNGYSSGSFVDLDNDGDKDFMSGSYGGNFYYFQNNGTASAANFAAPSTLPFGLVMSTGYYSSASFADLDNDGDKDMFSSLGGSFDYYQNTGTASSPAFAAVSNNPFGLAAVASGSAGASPSFADLDGDSDLDMISGNATGDFFYFQNTSSPLGITQLEQIKGISVYPNPTTSNVTLKLNNTSQALSVQVTNVLGQVVSTSVISNSTNVIELPEAKGMYFVKITTVAEDKTNIFKIIKN